MALDGEVKITLKTRGEGKVHTQILILHFACVSEQKFYFFENLIRVHKKRARESRKKRHIFVLFYFSLRTIYY